MFFKKIFKNSKTELEIMYQNAVCFRISWYSKIWWFLVKKYWCQQNSRSASHDSYTFWIFFSWGITVPGSILVGYVGKILGRRRHFHHPTGLQACTFIKKEIPAQVFFCEYCEICKNTYLYLHLRAAALKASRLHFVLDISKPFEKNVW